MVVSKLKFSFSKSGFLSCLIIFAAALIVRLLFLEQIASIPYFDNPIIDPKQYDDFARSLLEEGTLRSRIFYQAPLYSYFLAAIYAVFGDARIWPHIIHIILGASNVLWIYLLAGKMFSSRVALLSASITAVYGTFIFYEGDFYRENLLVSLYLWTAMALYWAAYPGAGRAVLYLAGKWLLVGALFGLCVITRENSLVLLPVVLYAALYLMKGGIKKKTVSIACVAVSLFFFLFLVARMNYDAEGKWTIFSSQGGLNFYLGNNPEMDRTSTLQPGIEWEKITSLPLHEAGISKSFENSDWFYRKAFKFILKHPFQWTKIMFKKVYLFWAGYEMMPNEDLALYRRESGILKVLIWRLEGFGFPFGIISPLAILGMFFIIKHREKTRMPLLWLILLYMASIVLYHVRARYRLPVVPFFIILSAHGLIQLVGLAKNSEKGPFFRALAGLAIFAVLVNFPFYDFSYAEKFPSNYNIAKIYHQQKKHKKALSAYKRALKDGLHLAETHNDLAMLYQDIGRNRLAVKKLKESIALFPDFDKMRVTLGKIYRGMGLLKNAGREYEQALGINKYNSEAFLEMAELLEKKDPARAKEYYHRVLTIGNLLDTDKELLTRARNGLWRLGELDIDDSSIMSEKRRKFALKAQLKESRKIIKKADLSTREGRIKASDAWNNIGVAYLRLAEFEEAKECFINSLKISYSQTPAHINLGSTYRKLGLLDKAIRHYEESLRVLPGNYIALNNLGSIYRDKKMYKKALEFYREALSYEPGNPTIERNIKITNKLIQNK